MIATIITRVFDPFIMLVVFLFFAVQNRAVFLLMFLSMVCFPAALLWVAVKRKMVINWDLNDRRERPKILGVLLFIEIMSLVVLRSMMDQFLVHVLIVFLGSLVGFYIITLFWKISGHAYANALVTGFLVAWFGWNFWPILFIPVAVSWSRVVRKDHTVAQVIAGVLYGWVCVCIYSIIPW